MQKCKDLKFFEVYEDNGNLSMYLANHYGDVEISPFRLPNWDFTKKKHAKTFLKLIEEVRPHFIWLAPPCAKWSTMQRLNTRDEKSKEQFKIDQQLEEITHLWLVKEIFKTCEIICAGCTIENPHGATSWETETMKEIHDMNMDAVCNRCRTGFHFYECRGND